METNDGLRILFIILMWIGIWGLVNNLILFKIKNIYIKNLVFLLLILLSYLYLKNTKY
jgi:hypothetical protein|uniref:Uncharacterized protein n=1 Tax=viral metagenome TaxID=1070528 RepID=A0A6C0JRV1_9ZZZZ